MTTPRRGKQPEGEGGVGGDISQPTHWQTSTFPRKCALHASCVPALCRKQMVPGMSSSAVLRSPRGAWRRAGPSSRTSRAALRLPAPWRYLIIAGCNYTVSSSAVLQLRLHFTWCSTLHYHIEDLGKQSEIWWEVFHYEVSFYDSVTGKQTCNGNECQWFDIWDKQQWINGWDQMHTGN